jgi:hypothetical protein
MISSASNTGTGGACANAWGHSDARGARVDTGSDAWRDPDPRCSGTPSGRNADSFSADADADSGINGKGNCGEHQRHPDDNDGCKSHHGFSSFPFLFLSTRAAPWPMDTRLEQAHSRD